MKTLRTIGFTLLVTGIGFVVFAPNKSRIERILCSASTMSGLLLLSRSKKKFN